MRRELEQFLRQLAKGPTILFLGQRTLALGSGTDPFLHQIGEKYAEGTLENYSSLLEIELQDPPETILAWMDERCRRLTPPAQLDQIAAFPWSSVLTSAIDTVWAKAFRRPWRELQPIFDEQHQPADARNRARLHCTYLYGNVNRTEPRERVPLTRMEWLRRDQVAASLARRLRDLVTPLGVLAIDGYRADDWFRPASLAPVLSELNPGQVHLFSSPDELEDRDLAELKRLGVLVTHGESLAEVLSEGASLGLARLGPPEAGGDAHSIELERDVVSVPIGLWNRVRTTATIVDDAAVAQPRPLSDEARYREFRAFLGSGDGIPDWDCYARGFAFTRHFEEKLRDVVVKALGTPGLQEHPIVLHGPTGSGKTIALAALARKVRLERRYPVLYIERRAQLPSFGDIDTFCEWAERAGAPATLIAWDGALPSGDYHDLSRYLASRGRNVVVVGTSYRVSANEARGRRFVTAPGQLTEEERQEFLEFLRGFGEGLDDLVQRQLAMHDDSFLVALYRLLPPVRGTVRAGVAREVRRAEEALAQEAREAPAEYHPRGALAQAFYDAGLIESSGLSDAVEERVGSELVDDFQHLTGLVMIPGRFGLRVPLELLLRALGHEGYTRFLDLLNAVDIFRWYEDAAGNIEIGARSRLEASLISQARAGGAETEVALVERLLLELRDDGLSWSGGREVDFAIALVRAVGPGAQDSAAFSPFFQELADTLANLRLERGLMNPRLMLQEVNLRRESAIEASRRRSPDLSAIDEALDRAETVVGEALELLPDEPRTQRLRSMLLVELASTMGARSAQMLQRDGGSAVEAAALVVSLRDIVSRARHHDPTSYYPVDVLAWATRNAVRGGVLEGPEKLEAISEVLAAFQSTEVDELEPKQIEQFHARRYEIASLIGDEELASDAASALKARGSGAALFLQALKRSGLTARDRSEVQAADIAAALDVLEAESDLLWGDSRCLDLYLDLWWIAHTGQQLFGGERQTPGLTPDEWQRFLDIVVALQDMETPRRATVLGFLRALALFHLNRVGEAKDVFKDVERQSYAVRSRRRVIRTYRASNADGTPRTYHGTIAWLDPRGRKGDIYVEELRTEVTFFAHDFRLEDPRRGLDVGEFHVAFNFLGPIADPPVFGARR